MELINVIRSVLITEKSSLLKEKFSQFCFEVGLEVSKHQIKQVLEKAYKVSVLEVKTLRVRGKSARIGSSSGYKSNWKKAIVTLERGQTIPLFEEL